MRPFKSERVAAEFERIKQRLKQEGYKLRRNMNANHTWKITGNFNGFYLVKYLPCGVWHVAPNDWHPSRDSHNSSRRHYLKAATWNITRDGNHVTRVERKQEAERIVAQLQKLSPRSIFRIEYVGRAVGIQ